MGSPSIHQSRLARPFLIAVSTNLILSISARLFALDCVYAVVTSPTIATTTTAHASTLEILGQQIASEFGVEQRQRTTWTKNPLVLPAIAPWIDGLTPTGPLSSKPWEQAHPPSVGCSCPSAEEPA